MVCKATLDGTGPKVASGVWIGSMFCADAVSSVTPTWNVDVKSTAAQSCPCGIMKVILVKFPIPVTDEVRVISVGPVALIAGERPTPGGLA